MVVLSGCFILFPVRMDTTEQCNAVISHFNGKFIKIASGALGRKKVPLSVHFLSNKNCGAGNDWYWITVVVFCALPPAPSQPLLCKFADSQRKKHAHGGFVPNGQTSDLRLVCICFSSYLYFNQLPHLCFVHVKRVNNICLKENSEEMITI